MSPRPTTVAGTIVALAEKYPGEGDFILTALAFRDLEFAARAELARVAARHVAGCKLPQACEGLCKRHHAKAKELGFLAVRVKQLRQLAEGK